MQKLTALYEEWCGRQPAHVEQLPGAGSNRTYVRLTGEDGQSVIGVVGTSRDENHAFVSLARHFAAQGLPVPHVLAVAPDELRYLQTDLGRTSLFDAIRAGREAGGHYSEQERALLQRTIRLLPHVQIQGARGLDFACCYPQAAFDRDSVMFDLNYFKYCFLKPAGPDFHELRLEADFRSMADALTSESGDAFLYRDFQARNVMVGQETGDSRQETGDSRQQAAGSRQEMGDIFFIDFQGGRRGPVYYDLASFLWQASAHYPDELRRELVDAYYDEACRLTALPPREHFDRRLQLFVLFRTLQVLGAYGFRGYFERKRHFIESIPPAIENLRRLLADGVAAPYPYLSDVLLRLCEAVSARTATVSSLPAATAPGPAASQRLVVRVFSFSYKKGIPTDETGHGGGYVFDCRSTHNPGRYEPYKQLTGLDEPVVRFLEDDGEILTFLDSVYRLADAHVARYLERGFTSLMFCFGCTGGQHRSVYSAQHLAEHLHAKFGIEVHLCHREQNITQILGQSE